MSGRHLAMAGVAAAVMMATPAQAETFTVKMLNRGEKGSMVFEPDYLAIQPGDTVTFRAVNKGHNAATIDGFLPEGAPGFKGQINEELSVTFEQEGFYGIKCSPHYAMGMVGLIRVGEAHLTDAIRNRDMPPRAKTRFDAIFAEVEGE